MLVIVMLMASTQVVSSDTPYSDRYGSKSLRLLQMERAYGQSSENALSANDTSGAMTASSSELSTSSSMKSMPASIEKELVDDRVVVSKFKKEKLGSALSSILPGQCWEAKLTAELADIEIEWEGGKEWRQILFSLADKYGFNLVIKDDECLVYILPPDLAESIDGQQMEVKETRSWKMKTNLSLMENLKEWSKEAGWELDWGLGRKDYKIDYPGVLTGSFDGADGVIWQVSRAYSDAPYPFEPVFIYTNKVLRIVPQKFDHNQE